MISDDEAEKAIDYLRDSAIEAAQAVANDDYMESFTSVVEAQLMREFDDGNTSAVIQKRNARADPRFLQQLDAKQEAKFQAAKFKYLREAAMAKLDAWRTMNANERAARP